MQQIPVSASAAPATAPHVIVDNALYDKQEAVFVSLKIARRWQWAARIGVRVCFLLLARALAVFSPWIASWPEGMNDVGSVVLIALQGLCVVFGFWTWTDRIFAKMFLEAGKNHYETHLRKLGYEDAGPEFIVDMWRLQMRLNEDYVKERRTTA